MKRLTLLIFSSLPIHFSMYLCSKHVLSEQPNSAISATYDCRIIRFYALLNYVYTCSKNPHMRNYNFEISPFVVLGDRVVPIIRLLVLNTRLNAQVRERNNWLITFEILWHYVYPSEYLWKKKYKPAHFNCASTIFGAFMKEVDWPEYQAEAVLSIFSKNIQFQAKGFW